MKILMTGVTLFFTVNYLKDWVNVIKKYTEMHCFDPIFAAEPNKSAMNFNLDKIPARTEQPRTFGLTCRLSPYLSPLSAQKCAVVPYVRVSCPG